MIFFLDSCIDKLAPLDPDSLLNAVQELVRAYRRGHHRIIIDRDVCDWLRRNVSLSNADDAVIRRIKNEYTQFGGIRQDAQIWVEIDPGSANISRNERAIHVPINLLYSSYALDRAILLVENSINDGSILRFIIQNMARRRGLGRVDFESGNGGGDSIEHAARGYLNDRRIVFAVVDPDFSEPTTSLPQKAKKLQSIFAEVGWPIADVVYPPCREIENLIPDFIVAMLRCSFEKKAVFEDLDRIKIAERNANISISFWRYFDIKDGVDVGRNIDGRYDWLLARMNLCGLSKLDGISHRVIELLNSDNAALAAFAKEIVSEDWQSEFGEVFALPMWVAMASDGART